MTRCPYCQSGRIAVEPGSSLTYRCTDCDGVARGKWRHRVERGLGFSIRDCDDPDHLEPNDSETKDT